MKRSVLSLLFIVSNALLAQSAVCTKPPGLPLGIREYRLGPEPVVVERLPGSPYEASDVIVAVDSRDILTPAGFEEFQHPRPGRVVVQFRRSSASGTRTLYSAITIDAGCVFQSAENATASPPRLTSDSTIDGKVIVRDFSRSLGFVLLCADACKQATMRNGAGYWTFTSAPEVHLLGRGGAGLKGMKDGDRLVLFDGQDARSDSGARLIAAPGIQRPFVVVLSRGDKERTFHLSWQGEPAPCKDGIVVEVNNGGQRSMRVWYSFQGWAGKPTPLGTFGPGIATVKLPDQVMYIEDVYANYEFIGASSRTFDGRVVPDRGSVGVQCRVP